MSDAAIRPLAVVPKPVLWLLVLGLCAQLAWHRLQPADEPRADRLTAAPDALTLRLAGLGDDIATSRLLLLYLQSFDNQPGVTIPFHSLDYQRVAGWLDRALQLDPLSNYPLFLANRVYASVNEPDRQRIMLAFIYRQFDEDPNRRWESLAGAAIMARHQLDDLPLAEKYAEALRLKATGANVPDWARQMDIFMLEEMGEDERALTLLDALLDHGRIDNVGERAMLQSRRNVIVDRLAAQH